MNEMEVKVVTDEERACAQRGWRFSRGTDEVILGVFEKYKDQPADAFINCIWEDADLIKSDFINQRILAPAIGYDDNHNLKYVNLVLSVSDGVAVYWFMAATNSGFGKSDVNSVGVQEGRDMVILSRFEKNFAGGKS